MSGFETWATRLDLNGGHISPTTPLIKSIRCWFVYCSIVSHRSRKRGRKKAITPSGGSERAGIGAVNENSAVNEVNGINPSDDSNDQRLQEHRRREELRVKLVSATTYADFRISIIIISPFVALGIVLRLLILAGVEEEPLRRIARLDGWFVFGTFAINGANSLRRLIFSQERTDSHE